MKGFKAFLLRGNVVELAVAVVVGAAFSKIVDAFVKGLINPVIGAIGTKNLDGYTLCIEAPCTVVNGELTKGVGLLWGAVAGAALTFLITAAVVYFLLILPMNKLNERRRAGKEEAVAAPTELELLTEIRDLLARQQQGHGDAPTIPSPYSHGSSNRTRP
ncbi:large conductance mechanosensitive channel protein MscL [Actinacidiphila sp. bgisy167]|uniref:large conductance mechanosensitive channel protein MscL n=1 Tax=Actinacidiphila sp. bgisy167 TaxID=3413797 RepID=UPI003D718673